MHMSNNFSDAGIPSISLVVPAETLESNRIVGFESHDERARSINLLRSQVIRLVEEGSGRLLGVTSATPAVGKTFVTLNLAAALSQLTGHKVLLCDLDLRRGSVIKALGAEITTDVSSYLRGDLQDWHSAIHRVNDSDLYVLPCIAAAKRSSALLSTDRFARMMEELRNLPQDMIILCDLPPVFASDDALLTAKCIDQYLLVVEHGTNTAKQVREAMSLLEPTPCLGTILNRYRGGFLDAYGYGYGDPYGIKNYGTED